MVNQTKEYPEYNEIIRKYLLQYPENINKINSHGYTALIEAALSANSDSTEETVQMLIDIKADVNKQNYDGDTALMMAAMYSNKCSTEKTVQMLIDAKANLNLQDDLGNTALILAARFPVVSSVETVRMLINANADLNMQTKFGYTALSLAAQNTNDLYINETIQLLIDAGAICEYNIYDYANNLQLIYNGLFFLDIPMRRRIEYYDIANKSYPYLLKHLYTKDVSDIIRILSFRCQFYHYLFNKEVIEICILIKN